MREQKHLIPQIGAPRAQPNPAEKTLVLRRLAGAPQANETVRSQQ